VSDRAQSSVGGGSLEGVRARAPGGVQVRAGRVAAVELEDDHAVGERPERLGERRVARDHEPRVAGPFLEPGGQAVAGEGTLGGEAVEGRVREAVRPVGGEQPGERARRTLLVEAEWVASPIASSASATSVASIASLFEKCL